MKSLLIIFSCLLLPLSYLIALPFDNFITFLPSKYYQLFTYIFAPLFTIIGIYSLIFDIPQKKNKVLLFIFGIIIFTHFNLIALSHEIPKVFQLLPSTNIVVTLNVIDKIKTTRSCSYQIYLLDSFYYGRICLNKNDFNNIKINDKIVLYGKKNILGFYILSYKIQKHNKL